MITYERKKQSTGLKYTICGLVGLSVVQGVIYLTLPSQRFNGFLYHEAEKLFSIKFYGVVFILLGLGLLTCWIKECQLIPVLLALGAYYVFWAVIYLVADAHTHTGTYTSFVFYMFAAYISYACCMSILYANTIIPVPIVPPVEAVQ